MNKGANIIDAYRNEFGEGYLEQPFSSLINEFIPKYYKIIEEAMGVRSRFGFDDFGSRELTGAISSIHTL